MNSEQAVQGTQVSTATAPPPSTGTSQGPDINVMLLLMMMEKGTLDSNGQLQKYYTKQQEDGAWEVDLMKAIEEGVSTQKGDLPYKGAEEIFDKYMKDHDMSHFDANQIIALHGLQNMTKNLKSKDAVIAALVKKVAHDQSEYNKAYDAVQHDEDEIKHCQHEEKSWKSWVVPGWDEYWTAKEAYYAAKLGFTDKPNLAKWTARLQADTEALQADKLQEKVLFSQGVYQGQDEGARMKAVGKYEVDQLQNTNKNIMSFSGSFFVALQQA